MISSYFNVLGLVKVLLFINTVSTASVAINRSGWSVTADSFETTNEPGKVLDGDSSTFWHSKWSSTPADPLPNWIAIDMKTTYNIHAVSIQPRPSDNANGRIGGHKIEVSTDNTTWQLVALGTYNNDATTKKTTFVTRQARYIRITATSEAQNANNQWTSVAEVNVFRDIVGSTPTPYTPPESGKGLWVRTVDFPLVPVAVSLLPNGKLLIWSAYAKDSFGGERGFTQTAVYDPSSGESSELSVANTQHDMFCPGISLDFKGRVIVTGGSDAAKTSIYDPLKNAWSGGSNMRIKRGYQSTATCSDGRIFNIGGSWSGGIGGKNGEIYDPTTNTWSLLPGALVAPMLTEDAGGVWRSDNHAWLFAWKDRTIFQAGPSKKMNWFDTVGNGNTTGAGNRLDDGHAMNGNAVMFDALAGKILTVGGAADYEDSDARTNAYVITIGSLKTNPTVTKTQNIASARGFSNAVVLPDGTVFVTGGQARLKPFQDATAALTPELWNPTTGTWEKLNPMAIPRTYHSVAILLPDATVFQGGGGLCGSCSGVPELNHFDAEIFVPPYLLNADGTLRARPVINSLPTTAKTGASLSVTTNTEVSTFSLIRFGTATHTVNTDQRRIPLTPSRNGNSYNLTLPADPGVIVPGFWLLFAIDSDGTPSVGKNIQITL
ncbi:hypothetical protein GQ44DRAFT_681128 [Phaeosphaeriaceae sp. PMI808]|nr:hypothetical protein GQ44DRAFT_681128 [Phaeosphaeriaceae sp. PMI808]